MPGSREPFHLRGSVKEGLPWKANVAEAETIVAVAEAGVS